MSSQIQVRWTWQAAGTTLSLSSSSARLLLCPTKIWGGQLRGRRRLRAHLPPVPCRLCLRWRRGLLHDRVAQGLGGRTRGVALYLQPGQREGAGQAGADGSPGQG